MTISDSERVAALQGLRILIVEDEMMVAMLMEDLLEAFGCTIVGPAASIAGHSPSSQPKRSMAQCWI
jgi:hypothetical protein